MSLSQSTQPRTSRITDQRGCRGSAPPPNGNGAFATALGYGLPVFPIGMASTRHVWERGVVRVRRGTVAIAVGAPIPIEDLGLEDRHALRHRTSEPVAALRAQARERLRERGVDPGGID